MEAIKYKRWTDDDKKWLKLNYTTHTVKEMAASLNRTYSATRSLCNKLHLFKDGNELSAIYKRPNSGQFSGKPHNTLYDHAITTRVAKSGKLYKFIRLAEGKWQHLHVYNWLKAGKAIPEGHVVRFKNGDTLNTDVSNLELVTRSQNLLKNQPPVGIVKPTKADLKLAEKEKKRLHKVVKKEKKISEKKRVKAEQNNTANREAGEVRQKYLSDQNRRAEERSRELARGKALEHRRREAKKKEPLFANRSVDYSQMIAIKIDNRTIIYAKPGQDVEAVRENYLKAKGGSHSNWKFRTGNDQ